MPLKLIAGSSVMPVSVAEVMDSFHGDDTAAFTAQATLIIKALTRNVEARLGRVLLTQTYELVLDGFPTSAIDLLLPDVQSIVSVKYIDLAGAEQTLASNKYSLDADSTPCWLLPAVGTEWPDTADQANALRIRFMVGYGDGADKVPDDLRLWIIAHAVQVLENPSGTIDQQFRPLPFVDTLLDPYKVWRAV